MLNDGAQFTEPGAILIVDDEDNIRAGLKAILTKDGHQVRDAASAEEALAVLAAFPSEAAIIDIRMPGMSGVDLLQEIGQRWPHLEVILLTGHGTLETAVAAVRAGAHDYLLKPARPDALRATVGEALAAARRRREQARLLDSLRRGLQRLGQLPSDSPLAKLPAVSGGPKRGKISVADITIDLQTHEVRRAGDIVSLTPSEFQLLVSLAVRAGEVNDYVTLVQLALEYEAESWEAKELIKRHVFSLRQKIEPEPAQPRYVLNVRGVGYRLAAPHELDQTAGST